MKKNKKNLQPKLKEGDKMKLEKLEDLKFLKVAIEKHPTT